MSKILPIGIRSLLFGGATVVALLYFGCGGSDEVTTKYRTADVVKGDLVVSVSATGTVEPEEVIDVGAQVAGLILTLGTDRNGKQIDFGSEVEAGTVLAKIDESLYATDVQNARAQVARAKADLEQARVKGELAERDWKRAEQLAGTDALSQSAFDSYRSSYRAARAVIGIAEAELQKAEAALAKSERNLSLCTIVSPVRGVIIDRRVNVGQTVVSSLNAPSLFLIAKDLTKMQVWVSVNEADIGEIVPGQRVTFTVDAFPGEKFEGSVGKIRLNATMSQNVVTYIVEVITDNSSGRLLPYLTASARFEVSSEKDVLLVPNSALRWSPDPKALPNAEVLADEPPPAEFAGRRSGVIWTLESEKPKPIRVSVGGTDGLHTEIRSPTVTVGMVAVVGEALPDEKKEEVNNPFAPKINRRPAR